MDWQASIYTLALCLISIIIEVFSASKSGKQWFEQLNQPGLSFSFSFWYVVGGVYYLICSIIAYRLFHNSKTTFTLPIILLAGIMLINGLSNFVLFKYRSLKWFYYILYPFIILYAIFIFSIMNVDRTSAVIASLYLVWLIYDVYYFYSLLRINRG